MPQFDSKGSLRSRPALAEGLLLQPWQPRLAVSWSPRREAKPDNWMRLCNSPDVNRGGHNWMAIIILKQTFSIRVNQIKRGCTLKVVLFMCELKLQAKNCGTRWENIHTYWYCGFIYVQTLACVIILTFYRDQAQMELHVFWPDNFRHFVHHYRTSHFIYQFTDYKVYCSYASALFLLSFGQNLA